MPHLSHLLRNAATYAWLIVIGACLLVVWLHIEAFEGSSRQDEEPRQASAGEAGTSPSEGRAAGRTGPTGRSVWRQLTGARSKASSGSTTPRR